MAAFKACAKTIAGCLGVMVDAPTSMDAGVVGITEVYAVKVNTLLPVQGHRKWSAVLEKCHVTNAADEMAGSFK